MMHILILSLLVAFSTGAPQNIAGRIAGGSQAAEDEFPYIASIQLDRRHFCSGFIYNERWILTTASCVNGLLPSQLDVVVGITSLGQPSAQQQIISVFSIAINEQYDSVTKMNDLALIALSRPVVFGSAVQAIRYDEVDETIYTALIMGWGATMEDGIEVTRLRKTDLTVPADCSIYGSTEFNPNYMICAGSDTSSPCRYDEGSPLVQNGLAIGIMSKNQGCVAPYVPSVFTRLSAYYYWLHGIAGQQPVPNPVTTTQSIASTTVIVPTAPCIDCETPSASTMDPIIPTAPCVDCETPSASTMDPIIPTAPCVDCETPSASTIDPIIPTAPCVDCETPSASTIDPIIPTAPCVDCETPSASTTAPIIPTAPCVDCETQPVSTTTPIIPTAPCLDCETQPASTIAPIIPTAPCVGCDP